MAANLPLSYNSISPWEAAPRAAIEDPKAGGAK